MDNRDRIQTILQQANPELRDKLKVDIAFTIELVAKGVLTDEERTIIDAINIMSQRIDRLLDIIKREPEIAYTSFMNVLQTADDLLYNYVLDIERRVSQGSCPVSPIDNDGRFTTIINDGKISCEGTHLDLKHVTEDVRFKLQDVPNSKNIKKLTISASETLDINCNIEGDMWRGTDLYITSKEITVTGERQLDVSGASGRAHKKAKTGKNEGENGANGVDGNSGQDGGNVNILTDSLINSYKLTIKSNGGNGGKGQDGGDGRVGVKGADGVGLSMDDFKKRFPDPSDGTLTDTNQDTCLANAVRFKSQNTYGFWKQCFYHEFMTREDVRVVYAVNLDPMAYLSRDGRKLTTYCIAFGTEGDHGTRGGEGGKRGRCGRGGGSGNITVPNQHDVNIVCTNGANGKPGESGCKGSHGSHGTKGKDNARVRSHPDVPTEWYHGYLQVKYCEERKAISAMCPRYKQEAYIEEDVQPAICTNCV